MDYEAKRILVCLRYGIGDVVMELPVLDALRAAVPRARITALGAEPAVELLAGDARVDEVENLSRFGLRHRWDGGDLAVRHEFEVWMQQRGFDLFLDVHHVPPPIGDVVWRGVRSLEADEWTESRTLAAGGDAVDAVRSAVWAGWGLEVPPDALPDLRLGEEERRAAAAFLFAHGLSGAPPIGLSPVASSPLKRWPVERLAAAASALAHETGRPLLLFCGPQSSQGDALESALGGVSARVARVGALPLRAVAALLERCALLLSNDTGLMHIAAAVDTPLVAVFGPTSPEVFLPPSPTAFFVGGTVACPYRQPGSLHPPGCWASDQCLIAQVGCIEAVSVNDVVAAARRALAGATRRRLRVLPAVAPGA